MSKVVSDQETIDRVTAAVAQERTDTLKARKDIAAGLKELRKPFGTYGRGWAEFVKKHWGFSPRKASQYVNIADKLAASDAERFEGWTLAEIERGEQRPRNKPRERPQQKSNLCEKCKAALEEAA